MNEQDLQPVLNAAEVTGRVKAKRELLSRISDLHYPLDIATEVMVWLGESDVDKAHKAD